MLADLKEVFPEEQIIFPHVPQVFFQIASFIIPVSGCLPMWSSTVHFGPILAKFANFENSKLKQCAVVRTCTGLLGKGLAVSG